MTALENLRPMIEAARRGEPAALDRLLAACQPDIRRYAYRHCLISDIDDAVQETLLIVVRRLRALRTVAAFSGWLFTIVRRECRRLERRVFGLDGYDEIKMEGWLSTHSDETLRIDLIHALESLPGHYREIRRLTDEALSALTADFEAAYSPMGRPSIAPEKLIRALLLQLFYSVRSERLLMEQLDYNLLFRWFVGLGMDEPVWVATVF